MSSFVSSSSSSRSSAPDTSSSIDSSPPPESSKALENSKSIVPAQKEQATAKEASKTPVQSSRFCQWSSIKHAQTHAQQNKKEGKSKKKKKQEPKVPPFFIVSLVHDWALVICSAQRIVDRDVDGWKRLLRSIWENVELDADWWGGGRAVDVESEEEEEEEEDEIVGASRMLGRLRGWVDDKGKGVERRREVLNLWMWEELMVSFEVMERRRFWKWLEKTKAERKRMVADVGNGKGKEVDGGVRFDVRVNLLSGMGMVERFEEMDVGRQEVALRLARGLLDCIESERKDEVS